MIGFVQIVDAFPYSDVTLSLCLFLDTLSWPDFIL